MYLASQPLSAAYITDTFSGTGSQTDYTMSVAPANTASMLVAIRGVLQDPSTYAIVGMTLRFSEAPPSGVGNISVRYLGIPASGVVNTAYRTVSDFTATAGQTTFTVPSYTVGFIDVFRNGARLGATDFTATTGTSITLAIAANANDLITTVSFSVSSVLNAIPNTAGSVSALNLAPGAARTNFGAGAVLQVVQVVKTDTYAQNSNAFTDIPNLAATITPSSATSKILVMTSINVGSDNYYNIIGRLMRGSTPIFVGDASGVRPQASFQLFYQTGEDMKLIAASYLDSPATTNATTYKMQIKSGVQCYINRTPADRNTADYDARVASSITLMEIAA